jgi:cell division protein FtsL
MLNKIKTYYQSFNWKSIKDLRTLGLIVFAVVVLLITWSGVKTIQSNYDLQNQIAALQKQNQVQQLENENLQLENNYYSTNQYLELSARQDLGLGKTGETELIVPEAVAIAHLAPVAVSQYSSVKTNLNQSSYQKNFESWMNFFLHRSITTN